MTKNNFAIGVFDSGIGGLSVLRELRHLLPHENFLYYADNAHLPYGERTLNEIADFARTIVNFFIAKKVKIIVIACNTASAAALQILRAEFPELLFVGMEPALKPAVEHTHCGKIGILATAGTFQGKPYAGVVERFAGDTKIFAQVCTGLAELIEQNAPEKILREKLENWIAPLRAEKIDQLALACTHYPLILPLIKKIAGDEITVIDPSPAIAKQVWRLLDAQNLLRDDHQKSPIEYFASGKLPQSRIDEIMENK